MCIQFISMSSLYTVNVNNVRNTVDPMHFTFVIVSYYKPVSYFIFAVIPRGLNDVISILLLQRIKLKFNFHVKSMTLSIAKIKWQRN